MGQLITSRTDRRKRVRADTIVRFIKQSHSQHTCRRSISYRLFHVSVMVSLTACIAACPAGVDQGMSQQEPNAAVESNTQTCRQNATCLRMHSDAVPHDSCLCMYAFRPYDRSMSERKVRIAASSIVLLFRHHLIVGLCCTMTLRQGGKRNTSSKDGANGGQLSTDANAGAATTGAAAERKEIKISKADPSAVKHTLDEQIVAVCLCMHYPCALHRTI